MCCEAHKVSVSLRWRLTLTIASLIWGLMLGFSLAIYLVTAEEIHRGFLVQLESLAQQYTQSALQAKQVRLRQIPNPPQLEAVTVGLFDQNGTRLEQQGDAALALQKAQLETLQNGQPLVQTLDASLWAIFFGQRRAMILRPIFTLQSNFQMAYVLAVSARDLAGQTSLGRLRSTIFFWLGLATLGAALLGYRLALWLSRPLRQIAQTAYLVGQGQLGARIADASHQDEIGVLKRDLNAMLERLERTVLAQRRFTADAAHDLRTPIAVLRTEIEICLRRPRENSEYQSRMTHLLERVSGLSKLCEDLLTLSKLESGFEQPFEDFLLLDALEHGLENIQHVSKHPLRLNVSHSLEVHGHAPSISRLVCNLLENASKAAKSSFGLRAERHGALVRLEIWDDGAGIPPEVQQRLFMRFAKGENSSGAGLGLAIAQEIARVHGTQIERKPSAVGATFVVMLSAAKRHTRNTSELF